LADYTKWPQIQGELVTILDQADAVPVTAEGAATRAKVSSVAPKLAMETEMRLEQEATVAAIKDAETKMKVQKAAAKDCISGINSITSGGGSARGYLEGARFDAAPAAAAPGGEGVALSFAPQWVHQTVRVQYQFTTGDCL